MAEWNTKWDQIGEKEYEAGVDRGVLYLVDPGTKLYTNGVAWNGLTAVNESPSGAEPNKQYADNVVYLNLLSAEEYNTTIEAFMSPPEFDECDGAAELTPGVSIRQQNRKPFGFCYRTLIGNDTDGTAYGYKLHLIYGCQASPSEKSHSTINDSPEAATLSWEVSTTPVPVNISAFADRGLKATSVLEIDSTTLTDKAKLTAFEDILYGTVGDGDSNPATAARLPMPDEVYSFFVAAG